MTNFYSDQLKNISSDILPLPAIKFKDGKGVITSWMHLTPECIAAVQNYLNAFTQPTATDQIKPQE